MQAYGTLASTAFNALAVMAASLLLFVEWRRWRKERADSEAAQARLVFGEIVNVITDEDNEFEGSELGGFEYRIHNKGAEIIHDVWVRIQSRSVPFGYKGVSWLPVELTTDFAEAVPAHGEYLFHPAISGHDLLSGAPYDEMEDAQIEVLFTDGLGLRWRRLNLEPPRRWIIGNRAGSAFPPDDPRSLFRLVVEYSKILTLIHEVFYRF